MITITQIEYLIAVDRMRHFAKAAKGCSVSQPSLSLQIQKVEEEIGFLLFEREKKPIVPTPKGERFLEQCRMVWAEHQKLVNLAAQDHRKICGSFQLGIIPTVTPFLVPYFLAPFSRDYPEVTLVIKELTTQLCIQEIRQGNLDAAILATPLNEKGIRERSLYYEEFWFYGHPQNKLLKKSKIASDDIDLSELWLLMDGHCFRNQILSFCNLSLSQQRYRNVKLDGGSLDVLRNVINRTWGYTLIPAMMRENFSETERENQTRRFDGSPPVREISIVYAREQWKADIIKAIAECVQSSIPKNIIAQHSTKQQIVGIK